MRGDPVTTTDRRPAATPDPEALARLLRDAGSAHHSAFAHANGDDPLWPEWYARWLLPRLDGALVEDSVEGLALLLAQLDEEHRSKAAHRPWPEHYAERLLALAARGN